MTGQQRGCENPDPSKSMLDGLFSMKAQRLTEGTEDVTQQEQYRICQASLSLPSGISFTEKFKFFQPLPNLPRISHEIAT